MSAGPTPAQLPAELRAGEHVRRPGRRGGELRGATNTSGGRAPARSVLVIRICTSAREPLIITLHRGARERLARGAGELSRGTPISVRCTSTLDI